MGNSYEVAPDVTIDSMRSKNIKYYLFGLVNDKDQVYDPAYLRKAMKELNFSSSISEPSAHITTYCVEI